MKLTKQLEKEVRQVIDAYWDNYVKGDVKAIAPLLDGDYTQVGSAETEVFFNKKDAVKFLYETIDQVAGKVEMRNRITKVEPFEEFILISDLCDLYVLNENEWLFYAKFRASSLLQKKEGGWKIFHQHSSFPDARTQEGGNIAIEEISKENLKLREAVRRRTIELEHKNRELEIETALERVRARTMAMQKSDELPETSLLLFQQFKELGEQAEQISIGIVNEEEKEIEVSATLQGSKLDQTYKIKIDEQQSVLKKLYKAWKKRGKSAVIDIAGEELQEYNRWRNSLGSTKFYDTDGSGPDRWIINIAFFSKGMLSLSTHKHIPDETLRLLERFAGVFDLTYTRFLDLQKAEAQAREAQIELGLERVRARAMAMQKSDELSELVDTVFKELTKLDFALTWCIINIIDESSMSNTVWAANPDMDKTPESYTMKFEDYPYHHAMLKAWKERKTKYVYVLEGREKRIYDDYLFGETEFRRVPEAAQAASRATKKYVCSFTFNNFGGLQTVGEEPLSEASLDILSRFGKVFDLTYTRFNDLQKAEAQAREAQIEAALERVRSRSMAMHSSDELREVVAVFYEQLQPFGLATWGCEIIICDEPAGCMNYWFSDITQSVLPQCYSVPFLGHPILEKQWNAWKEGVPLLTLELTGEEKQSFDRYLFEQTEFKNLPEAVRAEILAEDFVVFSHIAMKHGQLGAIDVEPIPDDKAAILQRFARVFEQTYTRFLDLKQAEEQAREAQIEAALERVRAKTMAMHHSDELDEVLAVLCNQFDILEIFPVSTHMTVFDLENNKFTFRETGKFGDRSFGEQTVDIDAMDTWKETVDQWRASKALSINRLYFPKETLPQVWEVFHESFASMPESSRITPDDYPDGIYHTAGKHPFGYIGMNQTRKATEEEEQIVVKFANEFGRAYQRFLDLQKAEAQAREAQIEAALERVRAKAMAMHKSEELRDVIACIFQQLQDLGFAVPACSLVIYQEDLSAKHWFAGYSQDSYPESYTIPYVDNSYYTDLLEAWQKGSTYEEFIMEGQAKVDYAKWLLKNSEFKNLPQEFVEQSGMLTPRPLYFADAYMRYGMVEIIGNESLSGDRAAILKRISEVFEQTYIRFLDLQKAEAQAREAQIEAALERVRSRTMAMHDSNELAETAVLLFQQFETLVGLPAESRTYIAIIDAETDSAVVWMTLPDGQMRPGSHRTPLTEHPSLQNVYNAWKRKKPINVRDLKGKALADYAAYVATLPHAKEDKGLRRLAKSPPQRLVISEATFSDGLLGVMTDAPLAEETLALLTRFARVFEQTYRRFLDLQKAEAQAREAQIEAAIERVRSRTMAMHKSEELLDVIGVISEQIIQLNLVFDSIGFGTNNQKGDFKFWLASPGQPQPLLVEVPFIDNPAPSRVLKAQKEGVKFFADILTKKENRQWVKHVLAHTDLKHFPEKIKDYILNSSGFARSTFILNSITLFVGNYKARAFTEQENNIFGRFAQVFEQSYTRFLDLKQAEAQAREAQIEVALERVRSRTMAMHSSDELADVVAILFEELTQLDFELTRCLIWILDPDTLSARWWMANAEEPARPDSYYIAYHAHPTYQAFITAWKERNPKWVYDLHGKTKASWDDILFSETELARLPADVQAGMRAPDRVILSASFNNYGALQTAGLEPLSDDNLEILRRFGQVFDMTYTRFDDLKQAEAQAREAQVEAALERVRAKAMAMHNSNDISDATAIVFREVERLGIATVRCGVGILDETKHMALWTATSSTVEDDIRIIGRVDMTIHPMLEGVFDAWKTQQLFYSHDLVGKDVKNYFKALKAAPDYPIPTPDKIPKRQSLATFNFREGLLFFFAEDPITEEAIQIFKRFASVFALTYRRYLDLKQAEAQAREAQIEAALEKVRGRAMAMHKSDELLEAGELLYKELSKLGITSLTIGYVLMDEEEKIGWNYTANPADGTIMNVPIGIPHTETKVMKAIKASWKKQEPFLVIELNPQETIEHQTYVAEQSIDFPYSAAELISFSPENLVLYNFNFKQGYVLIVGGTRLTAEQEEMMVRFTKVFEMTYRRFLDLKLAEAQAREAQIEAALERVRSRTMAMHRSEELADTAAILFKQVSGLGIAPNRLYIFIIKDETGAFEAWITEEDGKKVSQKFKGNRHQSPVFDKMYEGWKEQKQSLIIDLQGKELTDYIQFLSEQLHALVTIGHTQKRRVQSIAYFSKGLIGMASPEPQSDEDIRLLERFAKVFDLTYTRFNDLQQAEAQAREAQIEAALERVRSRTMAMQRSEELAEAAALLFKQVSDLGINAWSSGFQIWNADGVSSTAWMSSPQGGIQSPFRLPYTEDTFFKQIFAARQRGEDFFVFESAGKSLEETYRYMMTLPGPKEVLNDALNSGFTLPIFQITHCGFFSHGYLMFITLEPYPEAGDIFRRFTKVFEQTYTRFLDLQKAEAQARQAVQQATLDRVRAEIASMRTADDLQRITPLIWRELTTLGVPFFRCGVFIIDEGKEIAHVYLSTPTGESLAALPLKFDSLPLIAQTVRHWRQQEVYRDEWDRKQFKEWTQSLIEQGLIDNPRKYQAGEEAPEKLALLLVPFTQGMLYVGSAVPLSDDEIDLAKTLADAFAVAYARYEDFQKLEIAKAEVEAALDNLQKTQSQLVQAEKMASLGQLTAGIAHEIKNPLNFVNNFAELSGELVQELREEFEKQKSKIENREDIDEILSDLQQNAQKINEHGKRADSIVKGMLQHSRGGKGERQPTDLNAMLEEDLNLAYHGMRAQDSSFNVTMEKHFDTNLGKIDLVPQDISRVFLNIITNGFYAVHERRQQAGKDFSPTLMVQTRLDGDRVEIRIKDNGSGIPADIRENIFQPFFTTKPTGQGTGLGLSISYDIIVQEHHGEIQVDSKQDEFTEFIITLPVNANKP